MKKRLAYWFLLVAERLDPEIRVENAQFVEDYDAQKIGLTYVISKKDIKNYRFKDGARMSYREGVRGVLHEVRKNIRKHIIGGIDANHLIEYDVKEDNGGYRVSGELKVYVRKSESNEEGEQQETSSNA